MILACTGALHGPSDTESSEAAAVEGEAQGQVTLRTIRLYDDPNQPMDPTNGDAESFGAKVRSEIPATLSVTTGGSGDGWASLLFDLGNGAALKCCYRGSEEGYTFDRCGRDIVCSDESLGVEWGDDLQDGQCSAFTTAPSSESCGTDAGLCYFSTEPPRGGCAAICEDRGGRCVGAYEDGGPGARCEFGLDNPLSCSEVSTTGRQVCVCEPPIAGAEGECTLASCGPNASLDITAARLRVVSVHGGSGRDLVIGPTAPGGSA